jgi:post-segregation antitoxin (ccd killing protein)
MDMTGELVTIRVPKQLKRRTKTSNVNWSSELSNAIEHSLERRGYFRICSDKVLH